ncbi:uncharacterized protein RCO7_02324 [Rhynchosporium graminicola]|uniref:Uncharacterized protein n=1 Tax=Rhynchosporium graminicola TaxID=2792576 RepID=A0A1E1JVZ6_9HELO|nr:uncharacterized protein RCO7_02324 [Rhynchosporium commune]
MAEDFISWPSYGYSNCRNLPHKAVWLHHLFVVVFYLDVGLFVSFLLTSILQYTLYPDIWTVMAVLPVQSLFQGTFPKALATIIDMIAFLYVSRMLLLLAVHIAQMRFSLHFTHSPNGRMYIHQATLQFVTIVWRQSIVAPVVASATGDIIASAFPYPQHILWTIIASNVFLGGGKLACHRKQTGPALPETNLSSLGSKAWFILAAF